MSDFREHVQLGGTDLRVSRIGIGAGYGVPASTCEKAFHEQGVNFMYWSLSRRWGMRRAIRNLVKSHRDEMVITVQSYDHFGPFMERRFEGQLRKLDIDHADVLLLGWFNRFPPDAVMEAALRLRDAGKARYIAMSGHVRPVFAGIARRADNPIDIFMIRYNAVHTGAEQDVFPHLPERGGPGIMTYTTTCWGKLLNPRLMPQGTVPPRGRDCYRFALTHPQVNMCMAGPKNQEEMDEALEALSSGPMSADELEHIRGIGDSIYGKPRQAAA